MSEASKTARASMVSTADKKADPFDTNEKKISELRKQRAAKLAVVRYDFIDALIEEFDRLQAVLEGVEGDRDTNVAKVEELQARIRELENPAPAAETVAAVEQ